ncbi:hypothetical protein EOD39_3143 [Acipenser ruthenus]|uniref:Uncharacterized protein n=1 Tax=Acipenser ruthenus TaxID=7906 RepID=A0A444UPZ7_ACIRT|nr:hypothetical protein EOD39_3143 [Acipenser ruthenus]
MQDLGGRRDGRRGGQGQSVHPHLTPGTLCSGPHPHRTPDRPVPAQACVEAVESQDTCSASAQQPPHRRLQVHRTGPLETARGPREWDSTAPTEFPACLSATNHRIATSPYTTPLPARRARQYSHGNGASLPPEVADSMPRLRGPVAVVRRTMVGDSCHVPICIEVVPCTALIDRHPGKVRCPQKGRTGTHPAGANDGAASTILCGSAVQDGSQLNLRKGLLRSQGGQALDMAQPGEPARIPGQPGRSQDHLYHLYQATIPESCSCGGTDQGSQLTTRNDPARLADSFHQSLLQTSTVQVQVRARTTQVPASPAQAEQQTAYSPSQALVTCQ